MKGAGKQGSKKISVVCLFAAGVHVQAEHADVAEGAADAPQQHPRGGGHVHAGGPP